MIIEVDIPEFQLAIPGQSRTPKALWMRRAGKLDIPAYSGNDVVRAVKFKHDKNKFQTEIFRIGSRHYKIAEQWSPSGPKAGDARTMAHHCLCEGAWAWFVKNVPITTEKVPQITHSASGLTNKLRALPIYGDVAYRSPDELLRADYEAHMAGVQAGLVTINGYLFEPCGEPVYVVVGYGSHTVIDVTTDEELPTSSIAAFPLGRYEDAEAFAKSITDRGLTYGEIIHDVVEGAGSLRDDAEVRTLRNAAQIAAARFKDAYAGTNLLRDHVYELLDAVPLEDIAIYRRIRKLLETTEKTEEYADDLFNALSSARDSSFSASVFTDGNLFPLDEILALWEDRPIVLPGHHIATP
ncbi:hypothetical protein [Rhizobium sp. BK176]|uniref:hypothetical protein n=1 Tax=Rhizobium sp. BK176 TaxID=2587071 RepID=UPI0021672CC7|nr:hypothetical protein [Rhizobium sp. BK176]MCS4088883.1 hypothetical protein [Rhizobium sp. BK176]